MQYIFKGRQIVVIIKYGTARNIIIIIYFSKNFGNPSSKEDTTPFVCRTLNMAEKNYFTTDRDILAINFAFGKFKHYLISNFILRSDHKPLLYLKSIKNPQGKLARWILYLNEFQYEFQHIQGKDNNVADYLSQVELVTIENEDVTKNVINAHQMTGHSCPNVTYLFMQQEKMNPPSFGAIKNILRKCECCLKSNKQRLFKIFPVTRSAPFAIIGIDCMGPLPQSENGNK